MAVASGGQPDVVIGGGGNPGKRTPERLAELPLGLLREKAYEKLSPEESLRLLTAFERAMSQAPEEAKKQVDIGNLKRNLEIKGVLGGVAVGTVIGLGAIVGTESLETGSLVQGMKQLFVESTYIAAPLLSPVVLLCGAAGLAVGNERAEAICSRKLTALERHIEEEHRQNLAAALTGEDLDAIYLQASTR